MAASSSNTPSSGPTDQQVKYLDTATAYDLWSSVYDTDNNFLQNLDTIEMKSSLFPRLLSALGDSSSLTRPWTFVDLGCGTGRNTVHLTSLVPPEDVSQIWALDLSPKMLDLARARLGVNNGVVISEKVRFQVFNMLNPSSSSPEGQEQEPLPRNSADAIISTLVLEHVPLREYFTVAADMLKLGGLFLLTNMHGDMGKISQAGFVDPVTGEKIRPVESYAYSCAEVAEEAARCGFEFLDRQDGFEERMVTPENHGLFGPRAAKWIGVRVWYGGILRRVK